MLSGNLKARIDIYIETGTKKTYEFSFSERAEVFFAGAKEAMIGRLQAPDKSLKFKVRWRPGRYNEKQVIKHENDYYNIRGIDIDRDHVFIYLAAERMPVGTINIET